MPFALASVLASTPGVAAGVVLVEKAKKHVNIFDKGDVPLKELILGNFMNSPPPLEPVETPVLKTITKVINGVFCGVYVVFSPIGSGKTTASLVSTHRTDRPVLAVVNTPAKPISDILADLCGTEKAGVAGCIETVFYQILQEKGRTPAIIIDNVLRVDDADFDTVLDVAAKLVQGLGTLIFTTGNKDIYSTLLSWNYQNKIRGVKLEDSTVSFAHLRTSCALAACVMKVRQPNWLEVWTKNKQEDKLQIKQLGMFFNRASLKKAEECWEKLSGTPAGKEYLQLLETSVKATEEKCKKIVDGSTTASPLTIYQIIQGIKEAKDDMGPVYDLCDELQVATLPH